MTSDTAFLDVIRARLRVARVEKGLRQEDVAVLAKMELRSYQRFEALKPDRGRFNPSVLTLRRIALALQLDWNWLMSEPIQAEIDELQVQKARRVRKGKRA